jgi:hypothetical protein
MARSELFDMNIANDSSEGKINTPFLKRKDTTGKVRRRLNSVNECPKTRSTTVSAVETVVIREELLMDVARAWTAEPVA